MVYCVKRRMLAFYIIADMAFAPANHIVSHYVKAVLLEWYLTAVDHDSIIILSAHDRNFYF